MGHDHNDHDSPEYLAKQSKQIWKVGILLLVATCITWLVAFYDFGSRGRNIGIGLGIAVIKASLVGLIFMHLKSERGMIYKFLVFTVVFVLGLFCLTYMHFADPLHFIGFSK